MTELLNNNQWLAGATIGERPIKVYDDGYGPLWIHCDSLGITGIVRAQSWGDAYNICEDEFFPEADETIEELQKEYGYRREHVKIIRGLDVVEREATADDYPITANQFVRWETRETPDPEAWADNDLFLEAYGFRPNGANATDVIGHGIYRKDLNGDSLEKLTPTLLEQLEITLDIRDYAEA